MKEARKRIIFFLSIVFFVVLALALLSYFVFPLQKEKIKYTDLNDCNIEEDGEDCKYLFELENNETVLVTISKEKVSDFYSQEEPLVRQYMKLGDIRVWEGDIMFSAIKSIRVWGNLIIAHYTQGRGCGDSDEIAAYNSNVGEIMHYKSYDYHPIDPKYPKLSYFEIKIDDEKKEIEVKADNFGGCDATLKVPQDIEDSYSYTSIEPCNKTDVEKYNVSDDYATEATYLIKYQDNGSFSKPIQTSKKTFKEIQNEWCN